MIFYIPVGVHFVKIHDIDIKRRDFYTKIAKLYFEEDLSQLDISNRVGISRSNISRILRKCRELKIVEIKINDTSSLSSILEDKVKKKFKLQHIVVVPSTNELDKTKSQIGKAAAELFQSLLKDSLKIGISRGSTLYHLVDQFHEERKFLNLEVVQLVGGTGAINLNTDGLELARTLANKLHAESCVLQAPLIVQSKELREMLIREPHISYALNRAKEVSIALLGVGTNYPEDSSFFRGGFLDKEESMRLLIDGAVGDICGKQIDKKGNIFHAEINDRIVCIEAETLRSIPLRICVAGGARKAKAILGAMRGGFINSLVTDEDAALSILQLLKSEE